MRLTYLYLDSAVRAHFMAQDIDQAPAAYHERLRRKQHPQARIQTLAGIWLLRQMLADSEQRKLMQTLFIDAHNRPRFPQGPAFSISHTEDWVACAALATGDAASAIGLDLQQQRPMPVTRMLRLSRSEDHAAIERDPSLFFAYWCAREAVVKATGRVGLKRIRQTRIDGDTARLDGQHWQLMRPTIKPGVAACIACDAAGLALRVTGPLSPL